MVIEADLHAHTWCSDGLFSPTELVSRAAARGLAALAVTDHDTLDGLDEAMEAAPAGLEVIPGVELSSIYRGREIHLLAYYIDAHDRDLRAFLAPIQQQRRERAARIVERLNVAGVAITLDDVYEVAGAGGEGTNTSVGRPHIADAIVKHGAASDIDDAFVKYLRKGRPGFVEKACIPVSDAVRLTRGAGGVLAVAHPALNLGGSDTEALAHEGLDGIEVFHPKHTPEQVRKLGRMSARLGLFASGGSDYHGPGRNRHDLASAGVPMTTVERIREEAGRARA